MLLPRSVLQGGIYVGVGGGERGEGEVMIMVEMMSWTSQFTIRTQYRISLTAGIIRFRQIGARNYRFY